MADCAVVHNIGQMSERSKETVLKTVEGQPSASSNLALSALCGKAPDCPGLFHVLPAVLVDESCVGHYGYVGSSVEARDNC